MFKYLFIYVFILLSANQEKSSELPELRGKVVSIMDGDTFKLLTTDKVIIKVRLNGIDAPEKGQDFSKASKDLLGKLLMNYEVKVIDRGKDKYGRTIGDVFNADGVLINLELVRAGMAWHFIKYSHDRQLAEAESMARKNKTGLWQQNSPIPPWEYRKIKKKSGR